LESVFARFPGAAMMLCMAHGFRPPQDGGRSSCRCD
jgi:hypothetical protein